MEIAERFPLYPLPLRRLLVRFPTKVCSGQYEDGGTVKRLVGSLWYKTVLGNRDFYEDRQARNSSWLGAWLHSEAAYICPDHFHHSPNFLLQSDSGLSLQTAQEAEALQEVADEANRQHSDSCTGNTMAQPAQEQVAAQQQVGSTTEGSLAKVLTNEDGSLSTPKKSDPQQLVDGKTDLANAIYNNANLAHPEKVAPDTGTASEQDTQIMQGVVTSRTNGGADPVQGRHYYGTSHICAPVQN